MAWVSNSVVLFGGCDAVRCLDDVWLFDRSTWSRPIIAGQPPAARFGHTLVPYGRKLLVLGGCGVGPHDEHNARIDADPSDDDDMLGLAADDLALSYDLEHLATLQAARHLKHDLKHCNHRRDLDRRAALVAFGAARREAQTRCVERKIKDLALARDARTHWARQRARRMTDAAAPLDVALLDVESSSWLPVSSSSGGPSARIHFAACGYPCGEKSRVVLVGGSVPSLAEPGPPPRDDALSPYVADDMTWAPPPGKSSARYAQARKDARTLRDSARSLGVANANANLRVIAADVKVRSAKEDLKREKRESRPPPARFGTASCLVGRRLFVHGGWLFSTKELLTSTDEVWALNLESPGEEDQRQEREYYERLERFRQDRDRKDRDDAQRVAYETTMFLDRSAALEAYERCCMSFEHVRSSTPPLTMAPVVELVKAAGACLWLRWTPVKKDARGNHCHTVEHLLFMRGGFTDFLQGAMVLCRTDQASFKARITANHHDGTFDVIYMDGAKESKVPRHRLRSCTVDAWRLIYAGLAADYAVEALVPVSVLAREALAVECTFRLQTRGADFRYDADLEKAVRTPDELSLPSDPRTFTTSPGLNTHLLNDDDQALSKAGDNIPFVTPLTKLRALALQGGESPSKLRRRLRDALETKFGIATVEPSGGLAGLAAAEPSMARKNGAVFSGQGRGLHYI